MGNKSLLNHFFHNGYEYEVEYLIKNDKLFASLDEISNVETLPHFYDFSITKGELLYYPSPLERLYHNDESIVHSLRLFLIGEIDLGSVRRSLNAKAEDH